jgi:hypothetical protein
MKRSARYMFVCSLLPAMLLPLGCSRRAAPPAPRAKPADIARRPLPEWAPKHPSPEFLRAWKVLKPMPAEQPITTNMLKSGYTEAVQKRIRGITWPASYELFGSLADEHLATFLAKKEVCIPYKSLAAKEREALERWFEAEREAGKGGPSESADTRVLLYKWGAKDDFSNLRVGFGTHDTHVVGVCFWIIRPKGKPSQIFWDFAQI